MTIFTDYIIYIALTENTITPLKEPSCQLGSGCKRRILQRSPARSA